MCADRGSRAASPLEAAPTQARRGLLGKGAPRRSGLTHAPETAILRAMRLPGRRSGLTPLDEAAAYARCHGTRDNDVRIVKLPPRRPRYDEVLTTGEELRKLFERRLDAREPETS